MMLPSEMEKALYFYIGDVEWALKEGRDVSFWGDRKGYGTLNALFHPGITNEQARIAEGKPLNPVFLADAERLLSLCAALIEAARLCAQDHEVHTFRVEREKNFRQTLGEKRTVSFVSTSLGGFLRDYQDKNGLVLLEYVIPAGVPCIDMQQALGTYLKVVEQEVLLPPYLPLHISERPLAPQEMELLDRCGQPPVGAYYIQAEPWRPTHEFSPPPLDPADALRGQRVLQTLCAGGVPNRQDVEAYVRWKEGFCCQLRKRCSI